ncbi:MAG: hypothetical protein MUO26_05845 [Methanotrichaceae archaeon]|nr:hypothetical protein [Methanotrichaceae archaeon]
MKKVGLLFLLALVAVAFAATATAQVGTGATDILGQGIFETEGGVFALDGDTNVDQVQVGNDFALANGWPVGIFAQRAFATNNLEIKKNQDTGPCVCCQIDPSIPCKDCCIKNNLETIAVGNRNALAFGAATSTNNVKIVTNQA